MGISDLASKVSEEAFPEELRSPLVARPERAVYGVQPSEG